MALRGCRLLRGHDVPKSEHFTVSLPKAYLMTQRFNVAGRRLYDRVGVLTPFIRYERPG